MPRGRLREGVPDVTIPRPGFGTWQNPGEQCATSVATALEVGYRHVDTAQDYENEDAAGDGLARADVDRGEYVLATKVRWNNLSYDDVIATTEESLRKLGTDYVDLLYVHWPADAYDPEETFRAFAELVDRGLVRHVGVSNFTVDLLEEALDVCDVPIVANQIETHPYQQQDEMLEYLRERDMYLVAYSPLARGNVFDIPEIVEIAEKHDATPPQVNLAWLLGRDGVVPIPMADIEPHVRENWAARDLELDEEDVALIESIEREEKYVDPEFAPW